MRSFSGSETLKNLLFYMDIPEKYDFSSRIRENELSKLMANIFKRQNRKTLIWGNFGVGKSTLVRQLYLNVHSNKCFEDYKFVMLDVPSIVTKPREKLHQIFQNYVLVLKIIGNFV